jgi:EAL domain-containing protein (putative c-di-GMP-specific phosphodiesterase class I)/GGDEF domain-containing protein
MSMYRQLWLAIITSMLLALGGGLLASLLSARGYLESQLTIKNTDNATALALALSASSPDATMVELTVASLFDGGHYEWIRVTGPSGEPIVDKTAAVGDVGAPTWFVWMLPIRAESGRAQISNGWNQVGTVSLASHSKFAYSALWRSAYEMAIALTLAGLVGGYLGTLVLRRLRQPLNAVVGQAKAIAERRFVTIEEPTVPELRQLAVAMNTTVGRLKTMFDEEAARLEVVRREANCDELTGLSNRARFMAGLQQSLAAEDASGGTLLLVRLVDLAGINRRLGRAATDDFLRCAGAAVGECTLSAGGGLAARLNGADFSVLLTGDGDAVELADQLLRKLTQLAAPYVGNEAAAWIAMGHFDQGAELDEVLARVDLTLAAAQMGGASKVGVAPSNPVNNLPKSTEQWAAMIHRALERGWVRLVSFPVVDEGGKLWHSENMLRLKLDEGGPWLPAGRFMPVVERLRMTSLVDLVAVRLGLETLARDPLLPGLAVNLSASSLGDDAFEAKLLRLLDAQPKLVPRLWLEVAEGGALKFLVPFRRLCLALNARGCKIGLEHFGHQFSQVGLLHNIGLNYLKVDASFVNQLDQNPGNSAFLKGLASIAHNIDLVVIAEGVTTQPELDALMALGFDGATGPAVRI